MCGFRRTVGCLTLIELVVVILFLCLSETKDICQYIDADQCNSTTCGLHVHTDCAGALCSCQYLGQPLEKEFLQSLVYGGRPYKPECDKNPPLFEGASTSKLGTVKLKVYKFKGYWKDTWTKSAFNITFTNIKWTTAHIRFQNLFNESHHLFHKSFTRKKEDNVTQFFYDCFWNINYEGHTVRFQYEAQDDNTVEVREYRFKIPTYFEAETEPFMYVDVTDRQILTLWVQSQSPQNYSVELFQDSVPISKGFISDHSGNHLLSYSSPPLWDGVYCFKLEALGQNKTYCSDPSIKVVSNNIIVIAAYVVFGAVIISLLLLVLISAKPKGSPPSVLITYAASSDHHVKVIKALTNYLRDHCNTVVYLDDMDIPNSHTEDPLVWYMKIFTTVKYVMFISSPPRCLCSGSAGVTYRNMDVVALYLIRDSIERGLKTPKIFCVTLPYSCRFPTEVSIFHRFNLISDLDSMLKFLHGASCLQFHIPGSKKHLAKYGQSLSKAIKEAEQYNSKCVCGGKQEESNENDIKLLLDRLVEMQMEDSVLFESTVPENTPVVSNIPFPNVLGTLNLSGRTYIGMSRNERSQEPKLNIRSWKL